jgi:hypothetical protein
MISISILRPVLVGRNCFIAPLRTNPESQADLERQPANKVIAPYSCGTN